MTKAWCRRTVGGLGTAAILLALTSPVGAGTGNSDAAQRCQHGGYRSLVGSNGEGFRNSGECTSFAARGGTFYEGNFVVPAGHVATVTNAQWEDEHLGCAYDALTYGYEINFGTKVPVASKPVGYPAGFACGVPIAGFTVGPFDTAVILRIYMTDFGYQTPPPCEITYYTDPGPHVSITGSNPYDIGIKDSYFCASGPNDGNFPGRGGSTGMVDPSDGNWRGTLTITG